MNEDGIWAWGSRTVKQAVADTGLSRQELFQLMKSGVLHWMPHGGRGTRLIAWKSLVAYLEKLDAEHNAEHNAQNTVGAGVCTGE